MLTILVTGSDTGIGKTHVAATIGRLLGRAGLRVQFVKPVETGRLPDEAGDAEESCRTSGIENADKFTLIRFPLPLAPLAAAQAALGFPPSDLRPPSPLLTQLLEKWKALPPADLRIVEGAGGIAVPLDPEGADWCDFAHSIEADRVVLVIPDRLGAINQGRLALSYARQHRLSATGIWLNEVQPQTEDIRQSNREGLAGCPVWATQRFGIPLPEDPDLAARHLAASPE